MTSDDDLFLLVRDNAAAVLGLEPDQITGDSDLINEWGIDSLELMEVGAAIENTLKIRIDPAVMYEARTVGDVVTALRSMMEPSA
jgi:acyl carrier protein